MMKLKPQCEGIWMWGLWEVIKNGFSALIKEAPESSSGPFQPMRIQQEDSHLRKQALTKH